ncbi:MAG TPA: patatin-like phospholipase family protein [Acidimicrobiia bacterium]|nr:patatin-like phospholipase family protein [Acidimicrobiia bacterium]
MLPDRSTPIVTSEHIPPEGRGVLGDRHLSAHFRRSASDRERPRTDLSLSEHTSRPTPRVGLVLGGGGAVGAAYHAGVLAAMEHDLGWDARTVDVILGTSAGSLVGALLRLGVPATDLAALTVGAPTLSASQSLATWMLERPEFAPISFGHLLRVPRLPRPSMLVGVAKLAAKRRVLPVAALSMLLPVGRETLAPHLEFLDTITDGTWPDRPLLVCAVRRRDCRRTVFGPTETTVSLSAALAASCAVPGYFAEVSANGDTYLDGGVVSATNADLLARFDLDLVVIVSPMTGDARPPSLSHLLRRASRHALDAELRTLRRRGIPTVVVEPSRHVTKHMAMNFMSERASVDIVRSAFLDTGSQIRRSDLLRGLRAPEVA